MRAIVRVWWPMVVQRKPRQQEWDVGAAGADAPLARDVEVHVLALVVLHGGRLVGPTRGQTAADNCVALAAWPGTQQGSAALASADSRAELAIDGLWNLNQARFFVELNHI